MLTVVRTALGSLSADRRPRFCSQGGFTAVVIAAVVFVLLLAWPVIQTMEESFPKA